MTMDDIRARAQALVTEAWEAGVLVEVTIWPVAEPDGTEQQPQPFEVIQGGRA